MLGVWVEGTSFGRYRLLELLGRGRTGEVWRAHDTITDGIVAIKVLSAQVSVDPAFQERFQHEVHAAGRLNSPHAVPIHGFGEIDGRLYVDMRLIDGHDLAALLANGPLSPGRAVQIIEQVADALHAAHAVGLVHRDVKPSNVLIDRNGFAYLTGFGSADAIGTLHYIAPERLGEHPREDGRADVYALACVLYECLTRRPPFADASTDSLVDAHLNALPPQPSMTTPGVPAQLDGVIAIGMAKDPQRRYPTTTELARAARAAVAGTAEAPAPPIAVMATPGMPVPPRPARRVSVQAAVLTVAALLVLVTAVVIGSVVVNRHRSTTADPSDGSGVSGALTPPGTTVPQTSTESAEALTNTAQCGTERSDARLTKITSGRHDTFDRVVLVFDGPAPICSARYAQQLTEDTSGDPITLAGNTFLTLVLQGASAEPTYTGPGKFETPDLSNVRGVALAGDFEAVVTIGLGVNAQAPYKVFALSGPTRIVIDVGH